MLKLPGICTASLLLALGSASAQSPEFLSPNPMGGGPIQPAAPAPLPIPDAAPVAGAPAIPRRASARPKPRQPVVAASRESQIPDDPKPTFEAETFYSTVKASERYAAIADAGGWPVVPGGLSAGGKGKGVIALRRRLAAEGDLAGSEGDSFGPDVTVAIRKFQGRMGLRPTGTLTPGTLKAMNIPAATRFRQLASSSQRVAGVNFPFGERWIVVNIPSASAEAIDGGRVVRRYTTIVGDPEHRSPEVMTKVQSVNINPTWTVPQSIIKNEIIPKMQRDPGYLSRARIRILDGKGAEINPRSIDWNTEKAANYTLRQDSGPSNALGNIRLNMPNPHAVYMHDTPGKGAFAGDYRFLSHGCVRVQGVFDLAAWVLEGTGGAPNGRWDARSLQAKVATQERIEVKLAKPLPVIWVYMTGWASSDGTVHFRDDVYEVDKVGGRSRTAMR